MNPVYPCWSRRRGEVLADYIIPSVFDRRVAKAVSEAVSTAAQETGVARRQQKPGR